MLEPEPDPTFFESSPPPASARESRARPRRPPPPWPVHNSRIEQDASAETRTEHDLRGHLELVREKHILTDEQIDEILNPAALTGSGR